MGTQISRRFHIGLVGESSIAQHLSRIRLVRPGILGGSRVWKDESHDKRNHTWKADDASVYERREGSGCPAGVRIQRTQSRCPSPHQIPRQPIQNRETLHRVPRRDRPNHHRRRLQRRLPPPTHQNNRSDTMNTTTVTYVPVQVSPMSPVHTPLSGGTSESASEGGLRACERGTALT